MLVPMELKLEHEIAKRLRHAEANAEPIEPFAHEIGEREMLRAYDIQHLNTQHGLSSGRILRGRKIGLTAKTVQQQLGVDEPDYGALFCDMEIENEGTLDLDSMIDPKIEAEIALVLDRDIDEENLSIEQIREHVAYATSSLEIVDSRLKNWRIGIVDTIADNGASSKFVLGKERVPISEIDLAACNMQLARNGSVVSTGTGAATLGHPLRALRWLANILVRHGYPLRRGDLVLTGALGPVAPLAHGDIFEAYFDGMSAVRLNVR